MDTLRLGILGLGHRSYFLDMWHKPEKGHAIVAVCDLDEHKLEEFKRSVESNVYTTTHYIDLIHRENVDAIVIATPDYLHKEHAVAALKAEKHIYLEKPMGITIEECDEIIEVSNHSKGKVMIGFNMRYMSMYEKMKALIENDSIGDVKSIWVRHFVGRGGTFYFQDWHRNKRYTNSLLLQKGSHDFDVIHMLANSYTKKVSAFGSLDFYNHPESFENDGLVHQTDVEMDVEDNNVVIMELENGIKATYLQCHFTPDYSRSYTVIGTKGTIENDDVNGKIIVKYRSKQTPVKESVYELGNEIDHLLADEKIIDAFYRFIVSDRQPKASILDGKMSAAVGDKATQSLRQGGILKFIDK